MSKRLGRLSGIVYREREPCVVKAEPYSVPGFLTEPKLMAIVTQTAISKPRPVATAVLEQFANLDVRDLSPGTARMLLDFRFDASHHERVDLLSAKAQQGALTRIEQDELDEYLHVGTLLGILQSRARRVLANTGQSP